jgi:hypothetical protein
MQLIGGMITMGYVIAGLFFFRFWRRTGDTLFIYFGISFLLLALGPPMSMWLETPREDQSWIYLIRLAAFVVLIVGIVSKNLQGTRRGGLPKGR